MNTRPTSLEIKTAPVSDAEEILRLQKVAYRSEAELYNDYSIPPLTQTVEGMEADFQHYLMLKAEVDGRIVGSVRAYRSEGSCFIGRLIVHPDFQRRGIGTGLMMEMESRFKDSARFELFTGHKSEGNIRLYRRLGYDVFKTEPINDRLTLVYLEKRLPSAA